MFVCQCMCLCRRRFARHAGAAAPEATVSAFFSCSPVAAAMAPLVTASAKVCCVRVIYFVPPSSPCLYNNNNLHAGFFTKLLIAQYLCLEPFR